MKSSIFESAVLDFQVKLTSILFTTMLRVI